MYKYINIKVQFGFFIIEKRTVALQHCSTVAKFCLLLILIDGFMVENEWFTSILLHVERMKCIRPVGNVYPRSTPLYVKWRRHKPSQLCRLDDTDEREVERVGWASFPYKWKTAVAAFLFQPFRATFSIAGVTDKAKGEKVAQRGFFTIHICISYNVFYWCLLL